jgi:hypothetical protein
MPEGCLPVRPSVFDQEESRLVAMIMHHFSLLPSLSLELFDPAGALRAGAGFAKFEERKMRKTR